MNTLFIEDAQTKIRDIKNEILSDIKYYPEGTFDVHLFDNGTRIRIISSHFTNYFIHKFIDKHIKNINWTMGSIGMPRDKIYLNITLKP